MSLSTQALSIQVLLSTYLAAMFLAAMSLAAMSKPSDILLSLATLPLLIGLVSGRVLLHQMEDLGDWSQELLRGDRLPTLDFSVESGVTPYN
jgi:hypothetical protein